MSHEEIARRLREHGMVQAPPDLRADVMRAVRAEPRPARRRPLPRIALPAWRPVAAWAAVAACLLAAGVGISRLGGTGSSGGNSAASSGPAALAKPTAGRQSSTTLAFQSLQQARSVLGRGVLRDLTRTGSDTYEGRITAVQLAGIRRRYAAKAAAAGSTDPYAAGRPIWVVLRVRAP